MKVLILVLMGLGLLALVACADGRGENLQLDGFNISEGDYRKEVRSVLVGPDAVLACSMIQNATPEWFLENWDYNDAALPGGAVAVPGQVANPDDILRAGAIILEECDRLPH